MGDNMLIKIIEYIFISLIQSFTALLPISANGHLYILETIFKVDAHDIMLYIVTLFGITVSMVFYLRQTIKTLSTDVCSKLRNKDTTSKNGYHVFLFIVMVSVPSIVVYLLFNEFVESVFYSIPFVAVGFLITAISINLYGTSSNQNQTFDVKNSYLFSIIHLLYLIPGFSRVGLMFSLSQKENIDSKKAYQTILLSMIPFNIVVIIHGLFTINNQNPFVIGYIIAFVVSIVTSSYIIYLFQVLLDKKKMPYISIYSTMVGIGLLAYYLIRG